MFAIWNSKHLSSWNSSEEVRARFGFPSGAPIWTSFWYPCPLAFRCQKRPRGSLGSLEGSHKGSLQGFLICSLEGFLQGSLEGSLQFSLEGTLKGFLQGSLDVPVAGQNIIWGLALGSF